MMECEKCGSPTTMQVQAVVSAPGDLYHRLSKQNLRKKEVYLMGVLWDTADFICDNPKCQHVTKGFGNYVTNLKKDVERLNAEKQQIASDFVNFTLLDHPQALANREAVIIAKLKEKLSHYPHIEWLDGVLDSIKS